MRLCRHGRKCEGDKKVIQREKTDGKTEFERRRAERESFCMCVERMGASYTAHSVNVEQAAASSRLHGGVLS